MWIWIWASSAGGSGFPYVDGRTALGEGSILPAAPRKAALKTHRILLMPTAPYSCFPVMLPVVLGEQVVVVCTHFFSFFFFFSLSTRFFSA